MERKPRNTKLNIQIVKKIVRLLSESEEERIKIYDEIKNNIIPISYFVSIFQKKRGSLSKEFVKSIKTRLNDYSQAEVFQLIPLLYSILEDSHSQILNQVIKIIYIIFTNGYYINPYTDLFLDYLVDHFLINQNVEDNMIAKKAIHCIVLQTSSSDKLLSILEELHSTRKPISFFNINGDDFIDTDCPCIKFKHNCSSYLNAMIQFLYSIIPLRNSIISYQGNNQIMSELSLLFNIMYRIMPNSLSVTHYFKSTPNSSQDNDFVELDDFLHDIINHFIDEKLFYRFIIPENYSFSKDEIFCFITFDQEEEKNLEDLVFSKIQNLTNPPHILFIKIAQCDKKETSKNDKNNAKVPLFFLFDNKLLPSYKINSALIKKKSEKYITFVSNGTQWISCKDEIVKMVKDETLKSMINTNDGFLVYQYDFDYPPPSSTIKPEIFNYIEQMKNEIKIMKVFCTHNYFLLTSQLANLPSNTYIPVLCKYAIDSLIYTELNNKNKVVAFFEKLFMHLSDKSKNGSLVNTKKVVIEYSKVFFKDIFTNSCHKWLQKEIVNLLICCFDESIDLISFLLNCFQIIKDSFKLIMKNNLIFLLIYKAFKLYPNLQQNNEVLLQISDIFKNFIKNYLENSFSKADSSITSQIDKIDFSYIIKVFILFPQLNILKDTQIILCIINSNTPSKVLAKICKFYPLPDFINLLLSPDVPDKRKISLFSLTYPDEFLDIIVNDIYNNFIKIKRVDFYRVVCETIMNNNSFKCYLLNSVDKWLLQMLFNREKMIRINALSVISSIISDESLNMYKCDLIPETQQIDESKKDKLETIQQCSKIIDFFISKFDDIIKLIFLASQESKDADIMTKEFLQFFDKLLKILTQKSFNIKEDDNIIEKPQLNEISKLYQKLALQCPSLLYTLGRLLAMIYNNHILISINDLELGLKGLIESDISNKLFFMNIFLQVYSRYKYSPYFVETFFLTIVNDDYSKFNKTDKNMKILKNILKTLKLKIKENKSIIMKFLETKVAIFLERNYSFMVILLNYLQCKVPLLAYLEKEMGKESIFPLDKIVKTTLKITDNDQNINFGFLENLLTFDLQNKTKESIIMFIREKKNDNLS